MNSPEAIVALISDLYVQVQTLAAQVQTLQRELEEAQASKKHVVSEVS